MAYALLGVLMLFCAVMGVDLAVNDFTVWTILLFSIGALISLQSGYLGAAVFQAITHSHG